MKNIGVLTSSRADYGIYLPLLKAINADSFFNLKLIVFGTHLSHFHGYTINNIFEDGFRVDYKIESMIDGDSPNAVSSAMALTSMKFAEFWQNYKENFELVFCLGDRYEMFSAVIAGIPYGIKFAHIHGGEKTTGVIDNIFRHSITLASKYHFVSCKAHAKRVAELIESDENIFNVGALSLDNLNSNSLLSKKEFLKIYNIDFTIPTILVTVHPETINPDINERYVKELYRIFSELKDYQILITLPNADTNGNLIRNKFLQLSKENTNRVHCVENLGSKGYFSAMKYCFFLMGNTSSGIIEAASFNKWVINLGDRQKGRCHSDNVLSSPFLRKPILKLVRKIELSPIFDGDNIFYKKNITGEICSLLKKIL